MALRPRSRLLFYLAEASKMQVICRSEENDVNRRRAVSPAEFQIRRDFGHCYLR